MITYAATASPGMIILICVVAVILLAFRRRRSARADVAASGGVDAPRQDCRLVARAAATS
jgi:hypothetical protein